MRNKWFFVTKIAVFSVFLAFLMLFFVVDNKIYPIYYKQQITEYSTKYSTNKSLIISIIKAESNFDALSKSNKGAIGLMQIMPKTANFVCDMIGEVFVENNLFDPEYNIKLGVYYFSYLQNKFQDISTSLCAYNAGEGNVRVWLKDKRYSQNGKILSSTPFQETNKYVAKVKKYYSVYRIKF